MKWQSMANADRVKSGGEARPETLVRQYENVEAYAEDVHQMGQLGYEVVTARKVSPGPLLLRFLTLGLWSFMSAAEPGYTVTYRRIDQL